MATSGLFNPSLEEPIVRVTSTEDRTQFIISWPAQSDSTGYRVYAGFDPTHVRSLISGVDLLPTTQTSFTFLAPAYPPGQIVYYWVAKQVGATLVFLSEIGGYAFATGQSDRFSDDLTRFSESSLKIMCPEDQRYFMEEMRRRELAILEDTGEEVDLFIKQWRGLPDPTVQDELGTDPNYQAMTRDDRTFGSGFFPGYFPAIRMRMRFGALPSSLLDQQLPGLRPLLQNEAWTLWDPLMHENDLIVRVATGVRYVANQVSFSNYRSVPITQRLTLEVVTPTSPLQRITDTLIKERWTQVNSVGYSRAGFGVAANATTGGPDFLLFK